jgi:hypothetical protein
MPQTKFLNRKLSKKQKRLLDMTKQERELLDIYENAIGQKMIVSADITPFKKKIDATHKRLRTQIQKQKKRKPNINFDKLSDMIDKNEKNFELINRFFFIKDRIEQDEALSKRKTPLIAPFWMNFCGEKTKIAENIKNNEKPIDRVDALCKQHDIDFDLATTPEEARKGDEKLLKALAELKKENLGRLESFNRDMVEFMISGKLAMENIGVIAKGSFAGTEKKIDEEDITRLQEVMGDTDELERVALEVVAESEGLNEEGLRAILSNMRAPTLEQFKEKALNKMSDVLDVDLFRESEIVNNFLESVYINRQMSSPKKSKRAQIREQVQDLIDMEVDLEDFPPELLAKGKIESEQLRELVETHNKKRIPRDKLKRKDFKLPLSGSIESRLRRIKEVQSKLTLAKPLVKEPKPGQEEKSEDFFYRMEIKALEGKSITVEELNRLEEVEQKLGEETIQEIRQKASQDFEKARPEQAKTIKIKVKKQKQEQQQEEKREKREAFRGGLKAHNAGFNIPIFALELRKQLKKAGIQIVEPRAPLENEEIEQLKQQVRIGEAIRKLEKKQKGKVEDRTNQMIQSLESELAIARQEKPVGPAQPKPRRTRLRKVRKTKPKEPKPGTDPDFTLGLNKDISDELEALLKQMQVDPNLQKLIKQGTIDIEDIMNLREPIVRITEDIENAKVRFEDNERQEIAEVLDLLRSQLNAIDENMTKQDFNAVSEDISALVRSRMRFIIQEEAREEEKQKQEFEEKVFQEKKTEFEEEPIETEFKVPEKGDPDPDPEFDPVKKQTPIEDPLKTSTDRNNNTLPRDRRPFFFVLGTDLITKTEEENEQDIETFADFSWIPKDGNFYNGETNVIVQSNMANDIIRYDLNNQFGGLWMPPVPQPVFKLKPSNPLYDKMRVAVTPQTQHEQKRLAIAPRATPGRVQMYTQGVTGLTDEMRRNGLENRIIFPNVVDGVRV